MDYEKLYNFIRDLLKSVYSMDIPAIPQSTSAPGAKTFGDLSPNSARCNWSDRVIPVYIPKEWEKTIGNEITW